MSLWTAPRASFRRFAARVYRYTSDKASTVRAVFAADRALEIEVRHFDNQTQMDVRQGSWKTNAISNVAWLVATGLHVAGFHRRSQVIQKELEAFIRTALGEQIGLREVDL